LQFLAFLKYNALLWFQQSNFKAMKNTRFFELSISPFDKGEVAIFSKVNGGFAPLDSKSKTLKRIKRKFKHNISSDKSFCFSHMTEEQTKELESMLI
jgi:hypothetical protein